MTIKRFKNLDVLVGNGYVTIYADFLELLNDPQRYYEDDSLLGKADTSEDFGRFLLKFSYGDHRYYLYVGRAGKIGKLFEYNVDYYIRKKSVETIGKSYSLDEAYEIFLKHVLNQLEEKAKSLYEESEKWIK